VATEPVNAACDVNLSEVPDTPAARDARAFGARNGLIAIGPTLLLRNNDVSGLSLGNISPIGEMAVDCVAFMLGFDEGARALGVTAADKFLRIAPPPPGAGTPEIYYRYAPNDWRRVANQRYIDERAIYVIPSFFGFYQVFAAANNLPFDFGEIYVYPNPTRGEQTPTLHVEVGAAEKITTRIYDVSGDVVYEGRIDNEPILVDGKLAYELPLDKKLFRSGVYIGVVTAQRSGRETIRRQYRFTVIK
jgi:hypothetical protein